MHPILSIIIIVEVDLFAIVAILSLPMCLGAIGAKHHIGVVFAFDPGELGIPPREICFAELVAAGPEFLFINVFS